jgi:uncharacterized protein YqjF (DUF2071 family)
MSSRWERALEKTSHRPWPVPAGRWSVTMSWLDLLFMHWRVPARVVAALLPPGLELDTYDGSAWIGVVPFRMTNIGLRGIGSPPWVSAFAELNVRTYVKHGGKSGVWFLSLDAASRLAVETARALFHLPYFYASIRFEEGADGWIDYASTRKDGRGKPGTYRARYRPAGDVAFARPGTLDDWLTERYCFYAVDGRGRLFRTDVHHRQWPLQAAECEVESNGMAMAGGVALPEGAPVLHFARELDVVSWWPVLASG